MWWQQSHCRTPRGHCTRPLLSPMSIFHGVKTGTLVKDYRLSSDGCCAAIDAATVTASKALRARRTSSISTRPYINLSQMERQPACEERHQSPPASTAPLLTLLQYRAMHYSAVGSSLAIVTGATAALESAKLQAEPLKVQGHQHSYLLPVGWIKLAPEPPSGSGTAYRHNTHLGAHIDSGFMAGALDFPAEQLSAPAGHLQLTPLSDQVVST
ncbi:unnamed protein product [Boreogadus saida]